MTPRTAALAGVVAVMLLSSAALVGQAPAAYKTPRTPWGDPDLQGTWPSTDMVGVPIERPVEFGANKVSLVLFPPKARQLILEERLPLGRILKDCQIAHSTMAKAFFRVQPDNLIKEVLGITQSKSLYGRKATILDPQKRPLSEIVEILPPA